MWRLWSSCVCFYGDKRLIKLNWLCYYAVQNLLSSRLLSKSIKIRIYKTIILPVVLYGCEIWSLTLREEHRLRVIGVTITKCKADKFTALLYKYFNYSTICNYRIIDGFYSIVPMNSNRALLTRYRYISLFAKKIVMAVHDKPSQRKLPAWMTLVSSTLNL
jgi:hypothetical protein